MEINQTKQKKLPLSFYRQTDVIQVGKELLGKFLFTSFKGKLTGGMIIETESYKGAEDRACHAYGNRKTSRNLVMYKAGGVAYVYLCYGIHHLFNVVTHLEETPHAVLIRSIYPTHGIETMLERRNKQKIDSKLTSGPGTVTQALNIRSSHTGTSLIEDTIWLEDHNIAIDPNQILSSPRIGVDYAKEDALLPYRFQIQLHNNPFIP